MRLIVMATLLMTSSTAAEAAVRNVYFGGACSDGWTEHAEDDDEHVSDNRYGTWAGEESWNLYVRQTSSTAQARDDLKASFDSLCTGNNTCYVFTYSNGGAILSRLFSDFGANWNILGTYISSTNEGGSELSSADWLAEIALGCSYASAIRPTDHRISGWNHNDTNGFYFNVFVGEADCLDSLLCCATCGLLPGEDDGTVAFHSQARYSTAGSYSNACNAGRWSGTYVQGTCVGYVKDHLEMKNRHSCYYGGGAC